MYLGSARLQNMFAYECFFSRNSQHQACYSTCDPYISSVRLFFYLYTSSVGSVVSPTHIIRMPYRYALYTPISCCRGTPPTKLSAKARLVVACWKYGQESLGNPGSINVRAFLGHLFIFPACCCQMWLRGWFCWETRLTGSLKRPAKGLAQNGPPP